MKIAPECKELLQAISDAQLEIQPPKKDSKSEMFGGYKYASLGEVINQIHGVARGKGLVITQSADVTAEGQVTLHTVVAHVDTGQQLSTVCLLPIEKQTAQGVGSAITYMRRYQLMSIFMLAAEDDDGAAASVSPRRSTPGRPKVAESEEPSGALGKSDSAAGLTAEYVIRELSEAWGPTVKVKVEKYKDFMNNSMTPAEKQTCRAIIDRKEEANKK